MTDGSTTEGIDSDTAIKVTTMQFLHNVIGSHTIGDSRRTSFRQRLYNQSANGKVDFTLDQNYAAKLRTKCPKSGGDQNLFVLDFVTPTKFDNNYFKNLLANKGLLSSDEILLTKNKVSADLVEEELEYFFYHSWSCSMAPLQRFQWQRTSHGFRFMPSTWSPTYVEWFQSNPSYSRRSRRQEGEPQWRNTDTFGETRK
ncbi:unnamed protein product [Lupinus luteus]|uniref:peroxidase n=1 Tax=Lupinus luteus TaxID=3873 RepID=A0AAV1WG84_LUPLU